MDYRQMTSPCGLDCFNCPLYLANKDTELRAGISEEAGLTYEKTKCEGCRNACGTLAFLNATQPCDVYRCTEQKGISFCFECSDFPCDHLHPYADQASTRQHNTKLFNLCLIKKMGLESWAEKKAKSVKEVYFTGKLRGHSRNLITIGTKWYIKAGDK